MRNSADFLRPHSGKNHISTCRFLDRCELSLRPNGCATCELARRNSFSHSDVARPQRSTLHPTRRSSFQPVRFIRKR